jgi:hypothetical protein
VGSGSNRIGLGQFDSVRLSDLVGSSIGFFSVGSGRVSSDIRLDWISYLVILCRVISDFGSY